MPHDIFISYSRHNREDVERIKGELEAAAFSCWMDLSDIPPDETNYKRRIIPAIRAVRIAFLFFLSAESQSSKNALKEIGFAQNRAKKHVVLVRFNDDEMTDEFFYDYQDADIIDWRKPEQKAKLLRFLEEWRPLESVADPAESDEPTVLPLWHDAEEVTAASANPISQKPFDQRPDKEAGEEEKRAVLLSTMVAPLAVFLNTLKARAGKKQSSC